MTPKPPRVRRTGICAVCNKPGRKTRSGTPMHHNDPAGKPCVGRWLPTDKEMAPHNARLLVQRWANHPDAEALQTWLNTQLTPSVPA